MLESRFHKPKAIFFFFPISNVPIDHYRSDRVHTQLSISPVSCENMRTYTQKVNRDRRTYLVRIGKIRVRRNAPPRGTRRPYSSRPAAIRARIFPRGICIQSDDGGRDATVQESAESATDRLASPPSVPLLRLRLRCGASRFSGSRGPRFEGSLPSGSTFRYRMYPSCSTRTKPRIGEKRRTRCARARVSRRLLGERKIVSSSATTGERCRTVENPASTAEANR